MWTIYAIIEVSCTQEFQNLKPSSAVGRIECVDEVTGTPRFVPMGRWLLSPMIAIHQKKKALRGKVL